MNKGSGRQVLNIILSELSSRVVKKNELNDATRRLKTGLLVRGSTSEENHELISKLAWGESVKDGRLWRQGIVTEKGNIFILDLFESMVESKALETDMLKEFPQLTPESYEASIFAMWLILSSAQMYEQYLAVEVENETEIDIKHWVKTCMRHHENYIKDKD